VRDALAQMLALCNYRVIEADSAAAAIKQAEAHGDNIRLALMDIILPGMNGPDALKELHAVCPGLPVLYLSGYSDEILEAKGINGCHLQKPVHPMHLLQQVRGLLDAASHDTRKG